MLEIGIVMSRKAYHQKYRHVALQHLKKWLVQDPIGRNSIGRDKIFQCLQGTVRSTLKLVELRRCLVEPGIDNDLLGCRVVGE